MRVLVLIIGLGLVTALVAAQEPSPAGDLHQTYDLAPGGIVSVSNVSGYIRVTSWDENRVRIDAVKQGSRRELFDQVRIEVTTQQNAIHIRTIYPGGRGSGSQSDFDNSRRGRTLDISVNYDLKVPRSAVLNSLTSLDGEIRVTGPVAQVTARSTNGAVAASDVRGVATLTSQNGQLSAARITGALVINSTNGEVSIDGTEAHVNARSSNGAIRAVNLRGDAIVGTNNGPIRVERAGGRVTARALNGEVVVVGAESDVQADSTSQSVRVENARGRVTATTLGGEITVRGAQDGVRATAISGEITLSDIKGRVEAGTTSGNIQLRNLDSRDVVAKSNSGNVTFQGRIYGDGRYSFESFSGEVTVLIPSGTGFNLTARTYSGTINTEFPIQLAPGSTFGGARNLRGTAGDGGAELITASFSGSIFLKKAPSGSR